jgi:hypothetical protein
MRNLILPAIMLLALAPSTAAAASWQPATADAISAGVSSKSTFVIQADVTLPQSCDAARIRTLAVTSQLHRSYIVEMSAPSSPCAGKTMYKCTVVSPNFNLPIPHKFEVDSKGKTSEVLLAAEAPKPTLALCNKG